MFRRVDLPARVPGRLLLHSMPGRYEAIESVWNQVRNEAVRAIVCLPVSNARSVVSRAGSTVETAPRSKLISWCASQVSIKA